MSTKEERQRAKALESYAIFGTPPEEEYDRIAKIAAEISHSPLAQINLIDAENQYSKSSIGIPYNIIPREFAFCNYTIEHPFEPTVVADMRLDERFQNHPAVAGEPRIQFYTGIPLTTDDGFAIGSLCVMDLQPKELSISQLDTLKALAAQVVSTLDLRRRNNILTERQEEMKAKYEELEQFASVVSHDIKSPLNNIISLVQILHDEHNQQLNKEGLEVLKYLTSSADRLKKFIDGMLEFYRGDQIVAKSKEDIELIEFLNSIASLDDPLKEIEFIFPDGPIHLLVNKVVLEQIFLNLFTNGIKYNDKEKIKISVTFSQDDQFYHFTVQDNGYGIEESDLQDIFTLFTNFDKRDREGNLGTGIGLSTVKKLVDKSGGKIQINSELKKGTAFSFSILR